jgi:adenine-specific DNA-methyltransferase
MADSNSNNTDNKVTTTTGVNIPEEMSKLKEIFPQFIKDGELDFETFKTWFDENSSLANGDEKYGLGWAGKLEAIQAIRRPAKSTLKPDKEQSKEWDSTSNLFIEGDNLEVLKLLLRQYSNKIKMIYIDPPYNTGKDFVYKDNFHEDIQGYYLRTGQDKEGAEYSTNSSASGRFHSNWLNLMYPRLFYAKQMLSDDGVIFVSIDDNEVHNLRLIMDEIFGSENFIGQITREVIRGGSESKHIRKVHDYVLTYAREIENVEFSGLEKDPITLNLEDEKGAYAKGRELNKWGAGSRREDSPSMYYPIPGPNGEDVYPIRNDGSDGRWRLGKVKMAKKVADGDVIYEKRADGTYIVYEKIRDVVAKKKQFTTLFQKDYTNAKGTERFKKVFNTERSYFDYVKPTELIYDLCILADVSDEDIVMDFFAGSATTADAVMQLNSTDNNNRRLICVQLAEETPDNSEAKKAGYTTISSVARERIRLSGDKILVDSVEILKERETTLDIGFKAFTLTPSNYRRWQDINSDDEDLQQLILKQAKESLDKPLVDKYSELDVVYEVALKEGADLNAGIDEKNHNGTTLYIVDDSIRKIIITFSQKIDSDFVNGLDLSNDDLFVCLDSSLTDSIKANLNQNIKIKTI